MKDHLDKVKEIRMSGRYNCAQTLLMAYADAMEITEEEAENMGRLFGGGMSHGGVCGTISAAFMILGTKGYQAQVANQLLQEFRKKNHSTECVELLTEAKKHGTPKKEHCDRLIFEMAEFLDTYMK